jgi:CHAD domain-containing protein
MTASWDPIKVDETRTRAADDAGPGALETAELVHQTRKTIKRMRALARLLRDELGEQEFERVNNSLRAAGQRLAGARDAEVRLATLDRLRTRHPHALDREGVQQLRARLEHEREQSGEPASPEEVLADIADMRRALDRWSLVDPDLRALTPGLRRTYREGRHRHIRVEREHGRDPEHLHDWRKRVKALYYSLDMIGGLDAKGTRGPTQEANRLGDLLGEEHDLWMLSNYVADHRDAFGEDVSASEVLMERIERRRERLREHALSVGASLYKRKSGVFTRRIQSALSR